MLGLALLWSQILYYLGFEGGDSTDIPALNTYASFSVSPSLDLHCRPSQDVPSRIAELITQAQLRLLLGSGASMDSS